MCLLAVYVAPALVRRVRVSVIAKNKDNLLYYYLAWYQRWYFSRLKLVHGMGKTDSRLRELLASEGVEFDKHGAPKGETDYVKLLND